MNFEDRDDCLVCGQKAHKLGYFCVGHRAQWQDSYEGRRWFRKLCETHLADFVRRIRAEEANAQVDNPEKP